MRAGKLILGNLVVLVALIATLEFGSSFFTDKLANQVSSSDRFNHTWPANSKKLLTFWGWWDSRFPEPFYRYYNAQGWLEDYDIESEKLDNTYRIFYVGDSFIAGTVPMDQSVPSLVEERLKANLRGTNLNIEVINTGTSSYSPTLYYLMVRYKIMDYQPDLVIVSVDMTDDFDDWKYSHTLVRDSNGDPWAAPPRNVYRSAFLDSAGGPVTMGVAEKLRLFLTINSYTFNLIRRLGATRQDRIAPQAERRIKRIAQAYDRWSWCDWEWDDQTKTNVAHSLDLLKRLVRFCQSNGVRIMVTSVPHYWQYSGNADGSGTPRWSPKPHDAIKEMCTELKVPYLNSFEALRPRIAGTQQTEYYYEANMHFNPYGYALWAEAHYDFLMDPQQALLPGEAYSTR